MRMSLMLQRGDRLRIRKRVVHCLGGESSNIYLRAPRHAVVEAVHVDILDVRALTNQIEVSRNAQLTFHERAPSSTQSQRDFGAIQSSEL